METRIKHNHPHIKTGKIIFVFLIFCLFFLTFFIYRGISAVKGSQKLLIPVTIWDGQKRYIGKTSSVEIKDIASQNNLTIYPEDKVRKETIKNSVEDGVVGVRLSIERAPTYVIYVDDKTISVRSWGKTIGEVITGKVELGPRDIVEPPVGRYAVPDIITITRINVVDIESTTQISFSTIYRDDFYSPTGANVILNAGVNGLKNQVHKVTYKNGVEVSRILISENVTRSPVSQTVKRGVMPSSHPDFKRNWWDVMVTAGIKYGISPLALFKVAACESHVNPNSTGGGGTYLGMYQYTAGFWSSASAAAGFAGASWNNGTAQIYSTANYASKYGWSKWSSCAP